MVIYGFGLDFEDVEPEKCRIGICVDTVQEVGCAVWIRRADCATRFDGGISRDGGDVDGSVSRQGQPARRSPDHVAPHVR